MISNDRFWAKTMPFVNFLRGAGEILVLFFGGSMVRKGDLTRGEMLQFSLFLAYMYRPLNWVSSLPRWLAQLTTSLTKVFEIIDENPTVADTAVSYTHLDVYKRQEERI